MGLTHKAEQFLDLPTGTLSGDARVEILGNKQVYVAGHCEIREYEEDRVRLNTRIGELLIRGDRLTLDNLHSGGISVSGRILSVELE